MSEFNILIPARYHSTRFVGKPLALIAGTPMIEHVVRTCLQTKAKRVIVVTDDERIALVAEKGRAQSCIIKQPCRNGAERIFLAATKLKLSDEALIVNVQGDEPGIKADLINSVAETLSNDPDAAIASAFCPLSDLNDWKDANQVKVIINEQRRALWFSRAPIPYPSAGVNHKKVLDLAARHIGIYAYCYAYLRRYLTLPEGRYEQLESLEQLRMIENGDIIAMFGYHSAPAGIDTPDDLKAYERELQTGKNPRPT